ncbi:MAG: alpha/beta hydrolase [Pseudobacteriovorax sp.]|nr:alpha/beta hydrolase [Pseudobacteriovorax sp.]
MPIILLLLIFSLSTPSFAKSVVVVVRAGAALDSQFVDYEQIATEFGWETEHFHISMEPLRANHIRSYRELRRFIESLDDQYSSITILGYSIGGKFAARAARDLSIVDSVFLLDPVDGGPPILPRLWPHLPVFMTPLRGQIEKPSWIIETEFAQNKGESRLRCVNRQLGAQHFSKYVLEPQLTFRFIADAGHLEVIRPPNDNYEDPVLDTCPSGSRAIPDIVEEATGYWREFLASQTDRN